MAGFGGMAEMAVVAGLGIAGLFVLHAVLAGGSRVGEPEMPFVSGWEPAAHALSRYHVRWYPLTLLFLAFDVEMLFMYPWAVVVGRLGAGAVVEMFVFLAVSDGRGAVGLARRRAAMGLTEWIHRISARRVLLVEIPGDRLIRMVAESLLSQHGWQLATSPADADVPAGLRRRSGPSMPQ